MPRLLRERLPRAVLQALQRLEVGLVRHLAAVFDPVAEIEIGQLQLAAQLDLPQHVERAEARVRDIGS